MKHVNRLARLLLGLGLVGLLGCGGGPAEVTGAVTIGGKPLESGVVTFFPDNGAQPVASFIAGGTYSAAGVPQGDCKVTVTPMEAEQGVGTGAGGRKLKPGEVDPTAKGQAEPPKPKSPIPEKYRSVDTSGLLCKVDSAKVNYPIALD